VAAFGITGSLVAGKERMDLFGVVVVGMVTAIGGGTIRDMMLGIRPVFWVSDPAYLLVACTASLLTFVLGHFWELPHKVLLVSDAFGLAIFTVIGTQKALHSEASPIVAPMMGVMTGVAGGMIRDVLCDRTPLILRREIYATASLFGAILLVILSRFAFNEIAVTSIAVVSVLAIRLLAIRWNVSLPVFSSKEKDP
jgi:uncharacterized membrane protein YeiH